MMVRDVLTYCECCSSFFACRLFCRSLVRRSLSAALFVEAFFVVLCLQLILLFFACSVLRHRPIRHSLPTVFSLLPCSLSSSASLFFVLCPAAYFVAALVVVLILPNLSSFFDCSFFRRSLACSSFFACRSFRRSSPSPFFAVLRLPHFYVTAFFFFLCL